MLKHEDNAQVPTSPAAQVRVTPEELAAAVTALQIRKEGQPGTIAIGNAVEELGLDVTPEEVLAEMQAGQQAGKPKRRWDYWALACAVACATPLVFEAFASMSVPPAQHIQIGYEWLEVLDSSGRQVLATEVGDSQIFRCHLFGDILRQSDYIEGSNYPLWTFVKHGGKIYLRGWIEPKVSDKVLVVKGTDILNHSQVPYVVPITLSIDNFKVPLQTRRNAHDTSFYAEDIHLDSHAYEKW